MSARGRTVSTVEEIDALPPGSVLLCRADEVFWKATTTSGIWLAAGYRETWTPAEVSEWAPLTVLHERADLPAWATATSCVLASCSGCGDRYGDPDVGNQWHFESLERLSQDIADLRDGYDDVEFPWRIEGNELLCSRCMAKRQCAAQGHLWHHYQEFTYGPDERSIPEHWSCERDCGAMVKIDPAVGGGSS